VNPGSGEIRELNLSLDVPKTALADFDPAFSPDGRMLAFTRGAESGDLYLLPLTDGGQAAGPPQALTSDSQNNWQPAWTADGREIVFSSVRGGPSRLWRMKISAPGERRPVELAGEGGVWPSISRQGNRLMYQASTFDMNVWRRQIPSPGEAASAGTPICSSTKAEMNAVYSPDGRQIAFGSDRSGHWEIWLSDADGGHPRQATFHNAQSGSPSWSDDGEWIVYDSNAPGWWDIYVMRADGGQPRRLTNGPVRNVIGRFSRDGKWIYFSSMRTRRNEVWKVPFAGGDAVQVTRNGGWYSMESPDGKFLYYTKREQSVNDALWRMPVEGGLEELVLDSVLPRHFTFAGQNLYYEHSENGKTTVKVIDLGTRKSRALFEISKPMFLGLSVPPDQRWILYSQLDNEGSDLMLIENFR
jgi:Tol biopolymer transport system component